MNPAEGMMGGEIVGNGTSSRPADSEALVSCDIFGSGPNKSQRMNALKEQSGRLLRKLR